MRFKIYSTPHAKLGVRFLRKLRLFFVTALELHRTYTLSSSCYLRYLLIPISHTMWHGNISQTNLVFSAWRFRFLRIDIFDLSILTVSICQYWCFYLSILTFPSCLLLQYASILTDSICQYWHFRFVNTDVFICQYWHFRCVNTDVSICQYWPFPPSGIHLLARQVVIVTQLVLLQTYEIETLHCIVTHVNIACASVHCFGMHLCPCFLATSHSFWPARNHCQQGCFF